MSSSPCLGGGVERTTCGFDLDLLKSPSSSSSCSSECSSVVISTKRARTPRKRPNQSYTEAAILLSTVYPNVFSFKNLPKLRKHHSDPFSPFPALDNDHYLIEEEPPGAKASCPVQLKLACSPVAATPSAEFEEPDLPDYDVESILDEEEVAEEGIDGIMGKLRMEYSDSGNSTYAFNPFLGGLMGFAIGGRFGFNNIRQALRGAHNVEGEWWRPMVEVKDIVPNLPSLAKSKKKSSKSKKKKKVVKEEAKDDSQAAATTTTAGAVSGTSANANTGTSSSEGNLKCGLGLKLNYEEVLGAWSDREFPFTKEAGTPGFSSSDLAKLAEIDLTPDTEGGLAREASVQRFREKRRTRLFSKKIRYQVRKVNADCRPRMKASGRFVRRPSPLQEASKEDGEIAV